MGTVVTVMNMKGGVGKTTVAMHLGGILGRYKFTAARTRKVLLIDYDPQFNLSQAFLPAKTYFDLESKRRTTISILWTTIPISTPIISRFQVTILRRKQQISFIDCTQ